MKTNKGNQMTVRGVTFALIAHCVTKQRGAKSAAGVDRSKIIEIAQTECNLNANLVERAFVWLDAEGYIKLHKQRVTIRKAGWELAARYIKAFKRWYKQRNTKASK